MNLSQRLDAVAMMVTEGNRLADIGTDHAFVPIFLAESGRIPSALAMDVNRGTLWRGPARISGSMVWRHGSRHGFPMACFP